MKKLLSIVFPLLFSAPVLPTALAITIVSPSAPNDSSVFKEEELNQVVVTGTRTPRLLKETPVLTRVITSKDIAVADATNIRDLLQQEVPGVEFSYAMNQLVHLNFSGFGGQGMLFLVDGERLAGETMDDVDFSRLTMDNIDHIEIVKGAVSALYGSNANGGVVNLITKQAMKPVTLNVNSRWARHGEQRYGLSLGLHGSTLSNLLTVNYNDIDNYDVHNGDHPVTRVVATIYGDRVWNVNDRLTWQPWKNLRLTGRAGYFFRETTRTADAPERYRDASAGLRANWTISDHDALELNYAFDQYDKSDYQSLTHLDIRDYSNVQNSARALFNHDFGQGRMLTLGGDYLHDYLMNTHLNDSTRQQNAFDVFGQYDWVLSPRWEVAGALRYDYFSDQDLSHVTPKLNIRYTPLSNLNIRLGYGMGFRAPSLKEKYYMFDMAGIWMVEGNPDLKAETSHNINLSAEYTHGHYNFTLNGYYNKVENKIATGIPYYKHAGDKLPYLPYLNIKNYNVTGIDATAQARWSGGWSARLSYSFTHEQFPHDKAGNDLNNQYIPARKHSIVARGSWQHAFSRDYDILISLNGRFLSGVDNKEYADYYDISKGMVDIHYPAYTLWKLSLVQNIARAFHLTVAVDNLLNYKPEYYYLNCPLTDGANLMVGLSIDIDKLF